MPITVRGRHLIVTAPDTASPVRTVIEADHSNQKKNDWIHYAKIPNIVIMQWKTNYGVDFFKREDEKRWMRLLNSPEYKYLKCSPLKHD